jgi:FkbM family methyltransferase
MAQKKNLLFIGANDMSEIENYVPTYQNAIFIEALPSIYNVMVKKLENMNKKHNTNYMGCNCLVSDGEGKEYSFNIFSNQGASSSIYQANPDEWAWSDVSQVDTILLKSTTIDNIIKSYGWEDKQYDVILDVQGAELDVLRGFGESNFKNVLNLQTEISTKPFYKGGVLFDTLNSFLESKGFVLTEQPCASHCDVLYSRA